MIGRLLVTIGGVVQNELLDFLCMSYSLDLILNPVVVFLFYFHFLFAQVSITYRQTLQLPFLEMYCYLDTLLPFLKKFLPVFKKIHIRCKSLLFEWVLKHIELARYPSALLIRNNTLHNRLSAFFADYISPSF
jgi:hypothetical protein